MASNMRITAFVLDGDLITYATNERIRRATPAERRESDAAEPTGAFTAEVSERTLRSRCHAWVKTYGGK